MFDTKKSIDLKKNRWTFSIILFIFRFDSFIVFQTFCYKTISVTFIIIYIYIVYIAIYNENVIRLIALLLLFCLSKNSKNVNWFSNINYFIFDFFDVYFFNISHNNYYANYQNFYLFIYLFVLSFICLFIYSFICSSIYLFIHLHAICQLIYFRHANIKR